MWITRFCAFLMMLAFTAAPALAQAMPKARERSLWVGVVAGIVLTIAIASISIFSSKRGHQD